MKSVLLTAALASLAAAHFELNTPEAIASDESQASEDPCGGATPDISEGSDQLVDVHVGGEPFSMTLTHSRATWLFRATLKEKADGDWQKVFPIVTQSGLGDFCEPVVTFPEDWAGKRGVISVASYANDGMLFQCIAANFVEGSTEAGNNCNNQTGVSASFENNDDLDALVENPDDYSGDGDDEEEGSEDQPDAAPSMRPFDLGGLGPVATALGLVAMAGAFAL